jgi:ABC-type glutathione transport system ATPase component
MPLALRVDSLWKCYAAGVRGCSARAWVLRGVSLHVHAGERVAIVGGAGTGKSTLAACILGQRQPDVGLVERTGPLTVRDGTNRVLADVHAGVAAIVFARNLGSLRRWADRVLLLRDGRLHATALHGARRVAERAIR